MNQNRVFLTRFKATYYTQAVLVFSQIFLYYFQGLLCPLHPISFLFLKTQFTFSYCQEAFLNVHTHNLPFCMNPICSLSSLITSWHCNAFFLLICLLPLLYLPYPTQHLTMCLYSAYVFNWYGGGELRGNRKIKISTY